jgi:NAD kinase
MKKILLVYRHNEKLHFKGIAQLLKSKGISVLACERKVLSKSKTRGKDLVITLGGDGTFLTTSHYLDSKTPIVAINANRKTTYGFYTRIRMDNFREKLSNILKGNYKIKPLSRINVKVNGKQNIHDATNDVFFGNTRPHGTARYILSFKNKKELQASSGVIISTPQGTHGWMKSLGLKPLSIDDKRLLFIIREPIRNDIYSPTIIKGTLLKNDCLNLVPAKPSLMIGIDGHIKDELKIKENDRINICRSKQKVLLIDKC